jgi:hypothetical protein
MLLGAPTPAGGALFHRQGGDGAVHARDQERREEHGRILIQSVGTGANWSVHVLCKTKTKKKFAKLSEIGEILRFETIGKVSVIF